jgi:anaerobic magnesium-protoporphyrin IX monomethyl ester cyclase
MHDLDILLVNPPFSMPDKPCISIPVLADYLAKTGFRVAGLDLNNLYYRRLLGAENLTRCKDWVEERLQDLNARESLDLAAKKEYLFLHSLTEAVFPLWEELKILYVRRDRTNTENFLLFRYAALLASAPFFPEYLDFTPNTGYVRHHSSFHKFSSYDIYRSLSSNSMYKDLLEEILTPRISELDTAAVGISVTFPDQVLPAFQCARIIKALRPDIHITVGGAFISVHMRRFKEKRLLRVADSIILDDGERPLALLLKTLRNKNLKDCEIPGITYLRKSKRVSYPSGLPLQSDELPMPDYTIFPLGEYLIKKENMALLFRLSRGCYWAKCAFCRIRHSIIKDFRQPDERILYAQLKKLVEATGVGFVHFTDNAASPAVLESISRRITEDSLEVNWVVNLRFSSQLTIERLRCYRQAGCRHIYFGLESCTPRVLRLMNKGINMKEVERCLANCAATELQATVYMIVGFPTETEEEARASFRKILSFKEKGLIRNCIYNVYELVEYSAVEAAPEDYTVTDLDCVAPLDLSPPLTRFRCSGMPRQTAFNLCSEFIQALQDFADLLPSSRQPLAARERTWGSDLKR